MSCRVQRDSDNDMSDVSEDDQDADGEGEGAEEGGGEDGGSGGSGAEDAEVCLLVCVSNVHSSVLEACFKSASLIPKRSTANPQRMLANGC